MKRTLTSAQQCLLALLTIAALAVSACREQSSGGSSNTIPAAKLTDVPAASPTPLPRATSCPADTRVCDLSTSVASAANAADIDALLRDAAPVSTTCPSERLLGLDPLCAGASGEKREGFSVGVYAKQFQFVGSDAFRAFVEQAATPVASASPSRSVVAIGCARAAANPKQFCGDTFALTLKVSNPASGVASTILLLYQEAAGSSAPDLIGARQWVAFGPAVDGGVLDVGHEGLPFDGELFFTPWSP